MNRETCGASYQDDVPHPPAVCAAHVDAVIKEARKVLDGAFEAISKLKLERRGFQIMARKIFGLTRAALWRDKIDEGKYERAGGDVECPDCRIVYFEHPQLPGLPTFHMICSGAIVKT